MSMDARALDLLLIMGMLMSHERFGRPHEVCELILGVLHRIPSQSSRPWARFLRQCHPKVKNKKMNGFRIYIENSTDS